MSCSFLFWTCKTSLSERNNTGCKRNLNAKEPRVKRINFRYNVSVQVTWKWNRLPVLNFPLHSSNLSFFFLSVCFFQVENWNKHRKIIPWREVVTALPKSWSANTAPFFGQLAVTLGKPNVMTTSPNKSQKNEIEGRTSTVNRACLGIHMIDMNSSSFYWPSPRRC